MAALYKNLAALDSAYLTGRSEDSIVAVLRSGVGRDMKSFKEKLSPEQMHAVAAYLRVLAKPATP
jgi:mono/diheme cytochrome c family protein